MLAKIFSNKTLCLTTPEVDLALDYDSLGAKAYAASLGINPKQLEGDIFTLIGLLGGNQAEVEAREFMGEGLEDVMAFLHFENGKVGFGDVVAFNYDKIRLILESDSSTEGFNKQNFCIEVTGVLSFSYPGAEQPLNFAGILRINMGNMGFAPVNFLPDESSTELPSEISIPILGCDDDLLLRPDIKSMAVLTEGDALSIQFDGTLAISGGPEAIQQSDSTPHLLPLELSYKKGLLRLASSLFIPVLDLNLQQVLNINSDLGSLGLDVGNLTVNIPTDGMTPMSSLVELHCRLPQQLNNLIPGLDFINVYDPANPDKSTFKLRLGFSLLNGKPKLQSELISSPFKDYQSGDVSISTELRQDRLWWKLKLAEFGHVEIMSPIFSSDSVSGAMYGSGAFKIIEPLTLPLSGAKDILSDHGLGVLVPLLPGDIKLPMQVNGEPQTLGIESFGMLGELGGKVLNTVGLDLTAFLKLLPDRMQHFLTVGLPSEFAYNFNLAANGSCTGSIKLPEGQALKLLLPAGPSLYGIELRELSLGQYNGGQLGVLEVDGSIDLFMLPEIVASMAASAAHVPMLPTSNSLITQLKMDKLLALVDFKKAAIQPVFFDELKLSRIGVEGFELLSQWQLPKPVPDVLAMAQLISPLIDFVTVQDYLLDANAGLSPFNTHFEIGKNYIQLPQYLGATVLGKKGSAIAKIEAQDLWPFIAHALNFVKTGQVDELLACMPIEYRIGEQSISFFGLADIKVNYLLSSPEELAKEGFDRLKLNEQEQSRALAVLPDTLISGEQGISGEQDGNGLVALLRGEVNIANAIELSTTQGFAMTESGVHSGFNINGQLAQLLAIDIQGGISLNTQPTASIMLQGQVSLSLAGHSVMLGIIAIQNDNLYVSGTLDLFPYLPAVDVSAFIEGELSSSAFMLNGDLNFNLFGQSLLKGRLAIAPDRAELSANILGNQQRLGIAEHRGGVKLSGMRFNSFGLVNTRADVALSLDDEEMRINGVSKMTLPGPAVLPKPVAYAEMDFDGSMRLAEGVIKIDGKINSNSYVLAKDCRLKGDFAYYAWMNSERAGDFVFSLGGYHPKFKAPSHYPNLSRLEFGWKISKNLSLKGNMYAALTPACIMAGGQLKAGFKSGPLEAGFKVNTDFIVAWQPFYYEAKVEVDVHASVVLKVDFGLFTAKVTFSTSIGADLDIWGPDFAGKATIDWDVFEFSVKFGPKKNQNRNGISWSDFKQQYIPQLTQTNGAETEFIDISIESGQIGSIDDWLVADPDQLELVCQSPIPCNSLALKPIDRKASGRDFIEQGSDFHLAPRKAKSIDDWTVVVNYRAANDPKFISEKKGMYFEGEAFNKNFPKAVWGENFKPSLKSSRESVLPLLNGVRIVAANGKPPGFTEALDADEFKYQDIIENDPYWEWGSALTPIDIKDDASNLAVITTRLSESASTAERESIAAFFDCDEVLDVALLHQDIQSAFIGIPQVQSR